MNKQQSKGELLQEYQRQYNDTKSRKAQEVQYNSYLETNKN